MDAKPSGVSMCLFNKCIISTNSCSSLYHGSMSSIYYAPNAIFNKPVFVYICIIVADPIIKGMVNHM